MKTLDLPFFYGVQDKKGNGGFPETLPFRYQFDADLNLYRQVIDESLRNILREIYLSGSMLNGEMNAVDGGHQGKAALEFIYRNCSELKDKRVLEIGCGNGYILKQLTLKGARCIGLEPGPQVEDVRNEEGIAIINDFFPSDRIDGKFDLILHFNVLEHLENPLEMLVEQTKLLTEGGRLVFGMPNCEPNLRNGDISILAHEHCNYFTRDSFVKIAEKIGLYIVALETGASDGMIFCAFSKEKSSESTDFRDSGYDWTTFDKKIDVGLTNLQRGMSAFLPEDVAVYCPRRALNALALIGYGDCRIIEDTPSVNQKYLPFFDKPVENFETMIETPPGVIVIFSRTFGNKIKEKCQAATVLGSSRIFLIEEFDN